MTCAMSGRQGRSGGMKIIWIPVFLRQICCYFRLGSLGGHIVSLFRLICPISGTSRKGGGVCTRCVRVTVARLGVRGMVSTHTGLLCPKHKRNMQRLWIPDGLCSRGERSGVLLDIFGLFARPYLAVCNGGGFVSKKCTFPCFQVYGRMPAPVLVRSSS